MLALLLIVSIIAIGIYIQIKLSRSENKYLGLILPVIYSLFLLIIFLNTFVAGSDSGKNNIEVKVLPTGLGLINGFFSLIFLIGPVFIYIYIYVKERRDLKMTRELEKTKVRDL